MTTIDYVSFVAKSCGLSDENIEVQDDGQYIVTDEYYEPFNDLSSLRSELLKSSLSDGLQDTTSDDKSITIIDKSVILDDVPSTVTISISLGLRGHYLITVNSIEED